MPLWLQAVGSVNLITHLVTAVRGLMHATVTAGQIGWVLLILGCSPPSSRRSPCTCTATSNDGTAGRGPGQSDGLAEVGRRGWLWWTIGVAGIWVMIAVAPFMVLGPLISERELGGPPRG
jgi:hypothetical protein